MKTFLQFIKEKNEINGIGYTGGETTTPDINGNVGQAISPINFNCPNCGTELDMSVLTPLYNDENMALCTSCEEPFEYPWKANSWRWA